MSRPAHLHRRPPRRALAVAALVAVVALAACGKKDPLSGGTVVKEGQGCTISEIAARTDVPTVKAGTKVGKAVGKTDVVKGQAKACKADTSQYLTMNLVGATAADGKVFRNTWADKRPYTARLGQGQLIAGLETALAGMPVGARRQIVIPADQAYGKDGEKALGIGPDAGLVFVVDLLSLTSSPRYCNAAQTPFPAATTPGKPETVAMPVEAPTKVKTTVLTPGDGATITKKSYVTVDYLGVSCSTGAQFDASWDRGEPFTVALADAAETDTVRHVIDGWTIGLTGQKQGSTVQIDIPSEQGYGATGSPPAIGPSDPLTFIVKINEVSDKPPTPASTTTAAGAATTVPAGQ
jgi:peptidylprolyl isomerase